MNKGLYSLCLYDYKHSEFKKSINNEHDEYIIQLSSEERFPSYKYYFRGLGGIMDNVRVNNTPVDIKILESLSGYRKNGLDSWIKSFLKFESKKQRARNIIIKEMYDNYIPTGHKWILTGCLIECIGELKNGTLDMAISFNFYVPENS